MEKELIPGPRQGKYYMNLENLRVPESEEVLKDQDLPRGPETTPKGLTLVKSETIKNCC